MEAIVLPTDACEVCAVEHSVGTCSHCQQGSYCSFFCYFLAHGPVCSEGALLFSMPKRSRAERKREDDDVSSSSDGEGGDAGDQSKRARHDASSTTSVLRDEVLSIDMTGARDGEVFTGHLGTNYGAQIRITFDPALAPDPATRFLPTAKRSLALFSVPSGGPVDKQREAQENRNRAFATLMRVPFFRSMENDAAAEQWVRTHQDPNGPGRRYLEYFPAVRVQFLRLGEYSASTNGVDKLKKSVYLEEGVLTEEDREWLMEEGGHLYTDIAKRLPMLTDDGGSLSSHLPQWHYSTGPRTDVVSTTASPLVAAVVDLYKGTIKAPPGDDGARLTCTILPLGNGVEMAIDEHVASMRGDLIVSRKMQRNVKLLYEEVADGLHTLHEMSIGDEHRDTVMRFVEACTAGELKSLLQKLIRFRAQSVQFPAYPLLANSGECAVAFTVPTAFVLATVVVGLATRPGHFLPDLGVFVSGVHSLAKRLVVILTEDAAPPPLNTDDPASWRATLVSLMAAAYLSKDNTRWFPPVPVLRQWVRIAMEAWRSPAYMAYQRPQSDSRVRTPLDAATLHAAIEKPILLVTALLDDVRSFGGDLALMRDIAMRNLAPEHRGHDHGAETMPLWHYRDQHLGANIIYLLEPDVKDAPAATTVYERYHAVLANVFSKVTGFNPRTSKTEFNEKDVFVLRVRRAQWRALQAAHLVRVPVSRPEEEIYPPRTHTFKGTLDDRWLAAMVGDHEHRPVPQRSYHVGLDMRNVHGPMRATRKPGRDGNDAIDQNEQDMVIALFDTRFHQGDIHMDKCDAPHESLVGARFRRLLIVDPATGAESYRLEVRTSNSGLYLPWDEQVRHVTCTVKSGIVAMEEGLCGNVGAMLRYLSGTSDDCVSGNDDMVRTLLAKPNVTYGARVRALQWLSTQGSIIRMPDVARDPSKSKDRPMKDDIVAFQAIMLPLACLYPAALALVDGDASKFRVPRRLVLAHLRDLLATSVRAGEKVSAWKPTAGIDTKRGRTPRPFQVEAIKMLRDSLINVTDGPHVQLLVMPPGAGKTLVMMSLMGELNRAGQLPPYVFYTAPKSAFKTVAKEMAAFGFAVVLGNMEAPKYQQVINRMERGKIILLEHDWLRHPPLVSRIEPLLAESMWFFDEVHKMLNDTDRTAYALMMARACRLAVAFTGTPIINNDPTKPMKWLSQVLPCHVTPGNIWTSMTAFVTVEGYATTPIVEHEVDISDKLRRNKDYKRYDDKRAAGERFGTSDLLSLLKAAWGVAYEEMADLCMEAIERASLVPGRRKKRAMIVVATQADTVTVRKLLVARGLKDADIFSIGEPPKRAKEVNLNLDSVLVRQAQGIIDFTDHSVTGKTPVMPREGDPMEVEGDDAPMPDEEQEDEGERVHDYRVIIVPRARAEGYNLSRAELFFTSVYPSNEATRAQLRGRLTRLDQLAPSLDYTTVVGGILTQLFRNYRSAQSLASALRILTMRGLLAGEKH